MARPIAAITGATGFLGRWLVPALHGAGYDVRVLVGRDVVSPLWRDLTPEVVIGRLGDAAALDRLVSGADLVVHCAGLIKARSREAFFKVNADGAGAVARATAGQAPSARFMLISSLSAREPQLSTYAESKAAGEAAVGAVLPAHRLVVVRPPAVYGPGDRETLSLFKAAASLPVLPLPGPDEARFALIHVADAAAQIAALAAPHAPPGVWTLADGRPEGYRWREVMAAAAAAVGRPSPPMARLPAAAARAVGLAASALGRLSGEAPILTPGKVREMLHPDWGVRPDELAPGAPAPGFDLTSGFADAVAWYRSQGWI